MPPKSILWTALVLACGCAEDQIPPSPGPVVVQKGVTVSPRSFEPADFTEFLGRAKTAGEILAWYGDWMEFADSVQGGPYVVAQIAPANGMTPLVVAQFFTQATGELLRPFDGRTREIYRAGAVRFARRHRPQALGLGIEVNILYTKSPEAYRQFPPFFEEVRAAVRTVSPETRVFTVFQLEIMKGLGGGLFGGADDTTKAQWSLLDDFPHADMIAFTTYPGLVYKDPSEIPPDYYADVYSRVSKPVGFTEIGWHSTESLPGWESSDLEQALFVPRLFDLSKDPACAFRIWSFLYDPALPEPFGSMGLLRRSDGKPKAGWDAWLAAD